VQALCILTGIKLYPSDMSDDCAPGDKIPIIHEVDGQRKVSSATWWLLLERTTLRPNYKYASFNSRSDKLDQKRSIAFKPFRKSRCIIPASAFIEGLGDKKTYYKIELENSAVAFGGLYQSYRNQETGEIVYGASIITLPSPPQWQHIHPKSFPLMLPAEDKELINKWLDPGFSKVEEFNHLLIPTISKTQIVTPIDRPKNWRSIDSSFMIRPSNSQE